MGVTFHALGRSDQADIFQSRFRTGVWHVEDRLESLCKDSMSILA
jgi:hypothetical protein